MRAIQNITFSCGHCGKTYATKEEAEQCFTLDNTCYCLKMKTAILAHKHHKTDWRKDGPVYYYEVVLDFENGQVLSRITADHRVQRDSVKKNCMN